MAAGFNVAGASRASLIVDMTEEDWEKGYAKSMAVFLNGLGIRETILFPLLRPANP